MATIFRREPPEGHNSDVRTVPVTLYDELSAGTLRNITDQASAKDYQKFKAWIDSNR